MNFKPITFSQEYANEYWDGNSNKFARLYTYLQRGFGLFNETKNYILMLFGTYWTVKTADYWIDFNISDMWLIFGLFIVAVFGMGILLFAGRWDLFKLSKAREYATTLHGTITKFDSFNMNVFQTAVLEKIAEKLGVDMEKLKRELNN